ncbi:MFS transporter small subunit [Streptomyces sp. BH055]
MTSTPPPQTATSAPGRRGLIAFSWLWVGLPLAYGVYELVQKATQLFTG